MARNKVVKALASAVIWKAGRVLILKRAKDYEDVRRGKGLWEPPGGGIKRNEQVEVSLRRELREEIALTISLDPILISTCSYVLTDETTSVHRLHFVYAILLPSRTTIRLSAEHTSCRWVRSPMELARVEMIPRMRRALLDQMRGGPPGAERHIERPRKASRKGAGT